METGTTKSQQGLGLGLSVTRELIDLLGGNIRIESTQSEGNKVIVDIPRTQITNETYDFSDSGDYYLFQ